MGHKVGVRNLGSLGTIAKTPYILCNLAFFQGFEHVLEYQNSWDHGVRRKSKTLIYKSIYIVYALCIMGYKLEIYRIYGFRPEPTTPMHV